MEVDVGGGKNHLSQLTPRHPLFLSPDKMKEINLPRIPTAKKYKVVTTDLFKNEPVQRVSIGDRPVTEELCINVNSYHFRYNDDTAFENKHRKILSSQPGAFHRTTGDSQKYIIQSSYQDRAFNWKINDKRSSLSPPPSRYLIETLSNDPLDVDLFSVSRTVDSSTSQSLKSRHTSARSRRECSPSSIRNSKSRNNSSDLLSTTSSMTESNSFTKFQSTSNRLKEELDCQSQILQFEVRNLSKDALKTMDKNELMLMNTTAETIKKIIDNPSQLPLETYNNDDNSYSSISLHSSVNLKDPLAWTCTQPFMIMSRDTLTTAALEKEIRSNQIYKQKIHKKKLLSQVSKSLNNLKKMPLMVFDNIIISDILCTCVKLYTYKTGAVEITIHRNDNEIGRLMITRDKLYSQNILPPSTIVASNTDDETERLTDSEADKIIKTKWSTWFRNLFLPRMVLKPWTLSQNDECGIMSNRINGKPVEKYLVDIIPPRVTIGKGIRWKLTLDENTNTYKNSSKLQQPNPILVALYFRDTSRSK